MSKEEKIIKKYLLDEANIHIPISRLAVLAQRDGVVFCSPTTWFVKAKQFGIMRPGKRIHPEKPKIGIRASLPNEIWHLDLSVVRLTDDTKAYIQIIIDNYSRYILGRQVMSQISGEGTGELIKVALKESLRLGKLNTPEVIVDGGTENINEKVNSLITSGSITRKIAQIEISESNSMVEALFRSSKHNYLFKKNLDSEAALRSHFEFYVNEHNTRVPHSALKGATPIEVFTGTWTISKEFELKTKIAKARQERIAYHQKLSCKKCS